MNIFAKLRSLFRRKPQPEPEVVTVYQLTPQVLQDIEKHFPIGVTNNTSTESVAFQLGQQSILAVLRNAYSRK